MTVRLGEVFQLSHNVTIFEAETRNLITFARAEFVAEEMERSRVDERLGGGSGHVWR